MYYFASDQHLGLKDCGDTTAREELVVRWLDEVSQDAKAIFLLGDLFDFWFEYRRVIPKGFSRLLGKLSELTDRGVEVRFFSGNHDMWAFDYLETECGVKVHIKEEVMELDGKRVFLAHGDNLIWDTWVLKLMSWGFRAKFFRWIFIHFFHPNTAMKFGLWWSQHNRKSRSIRHEFMGEEEYLIRFVRKYLETNDVDLFIFGHIHSAVDYDLGEGRRAIFLGEWVEQPTYAVMRNGEIELKSYK